MDEEKERKARLIRLKILRLQKELAATQQHARLGSFLHANRPAAIWSQAERERKRIEEEIAGLREQLAALTKPEEAVPVKTKKAATPKKAATKKRSPAAKTPAKKKAAPKKSAGKRAK
ncbi:MAG: hypothetical protein V1784_04355 [bacterium]